MYEEMKDYIHLDSPVIEINNSKNDFTEITLRDGTTRSCKRIIIAVPPQVISRQTNFTNLP